MQFEQFLNCKYMYSQVTVKYVNVRLLQLRLMDLSRSHSSVGNSNTISQHHQQMATTTQTKHPRLRHQLNHHVSFQSSDSPQYCIDIDNDLHLHGSSSSDEANNNTRDMTPIQQRVAVVNGNASSSPHPRPACSRSMSLPYPASASVARANCIREFLSAEQEYVKLLGNLVEVSNLDIE